MTKEWGRHGPNIMPEGDGASPLLDPIHGFRFAAFLTLFFAAFG
jgi:hypothetical protein